VGKTPFLQKTCKKVAIILKQVARMAELVDALDSKSSFRKEVRVRPPLRVPFLFHSFGMAIIRRGRESDMPALRDIINHYITESVVTFEMVKCHWKIEKLGLPSF